MAFLKTRKLYTAGFKFNVALFDETNNEETNIENVNRATTRNFRV